MKFSIVEFAAEPRAATPTIATTLRVDVAPDEAVAALALRCQVQIEAARRTYSDEEVAALYPVFGTRAEFGRTLRSLLWTHVDVVFPGFTGHAQVRLLLPCSFDLTVAATRLFAALTAGDVPLRLLFSGTFFKIVDGAVQTTPVPWTAELAANMPAALFHEILDQHHPEAAFVPLHREIIKKLDEHRLARGLLTWDRTLEDLLRARDR